MWLRWSQPNLVRPYKVPLGTLGVTVMSVPATGLLLLVMFYASRKTVVISCGLLVLGCLTYPLLQHAKAKQWCEFVHPHTVPVAYDSGSSSPTAGDESELRPLTGH